jgi:hypothetical protein
LGGVCRDAEVREIDGVHFDLRHPDLDRNVWSPVVLLGDPYDLGPHTPRILFPWSSSMERTAHKARGDAVTVREGETVVVTDVRSLPVSSDQGALDHPHHRECRWAHLAVKTSGGRLKPVHQAWEFRGTADVMTPLARGDYDNARWALYARLCAALGIDDIDSIILAGSRDDWPAFADAAHPLYLKALDALWAAEGEGVEEASAVFGYLIGRAEASERLLPLASRQAAVQTNNQRSAKKPRKAGEETRKAALSIIHGHPTISRRKCAERVAEQRELTDIRSVEERITEFFEKGLNGRYTPTIMALAMARSVSKGGG